MVALLALSTTQVAAQVTLEDVLSHLLRRESLLTVAGHKALSIVHVKSPLEALEQLNAAQAQKKIHPDFGWFLVHTARNATGGQYGILYFYRKSLFGKLVRDSSAMSILSAFGFEATDSADKIAQKLKAADKALTHGPRDAMLGVFLGFPLREVLQFTQEQYRGPNRSKRDGETRREVHAFKDAVFDLGVFMDLTGQSGAEIAEYKRKAEEAVARYKAAVRNGYSDLAILNEWNSSKLTTRISSDPSCERLVGGGL